MANNYNDILTLVNAGNQMGLSNTIRRDYGIPLDFTSVQESYDAAVIYAATSTLAYVGQTVAVGGKLYIISDVATTKHIVGEDEYDNYLSEVGSSTDGDGNTIEFNGQTLTLAGLTGLDNAKTYVPSLVNGKLVWAEPNTSTSEGQALEINAVKIRTAALEATVNGVEAAEGVEAQEGLVDKVSTLFTSIENEVAAREAADTAIEQAQADATNAINSITALTNGQVKTNSDDIATVKTRLDTLETAKGNHESRIGTAEGRITALEEADAKFTSDIAGVSTTVEGHTTTINGHSTKLTELAAKDAALETKIDANTAKFADYSTTTEVENAIDAKIAAIPAADLTDYAKSADVEATYAKIGDSYTKAEADAAFMTQDEVDDRLNALINAADPEGGKTITDVQNLVKYVEENAGEIAALVTETDANTAKLAGIETTVTAYVNDALAAMIQPKASDEISVAEDGTLGIVGMNVNKLVQTEGDELVLNGGNA